MELHKNPQMGNPKIVKFSPLSSINYSKTQNFKSLNELTGPLIGKFTALRGEDEGVPASLDGGRHDLLALRPHPHPLRLAVRPRRRRRGRPNSGGGGRVLGNH